MREDRIKKGAIAGLIILLLTIFVGVFLYGYKKQEARQAAIDNIAVEVKPYEKQIENLKNKIQLLDIKQSNAEKSTLSIGFLLKNSKDFKRIKNYESTYGFVATAIVDTDQDNADELAKLAKENQMEVILTSALIKENAFDRVEAIKETLVESDAECFFVRSNQETNENLYQELKDNGFKGAVRYNAKAEDERVDDFVKFGYIYIPNDGIDLGSKLSAYITNKQSAIIIFDCANIGKTLTANAINDYMTTLSNVRSNDDANITSTTSLITTINNTFDIAAISQNDIDAYRAQLVKELEDVEAQAKAIYKKHGK